MAYFHYRCGERITLLNDSCTAVRNDNEFDHGIVVSAEPLVSDVLFEIKIDRKVNSWSGSLVIGVTICDPMHLEFPPCASKLQNGSWIMAGNCILKDGILLVERYGTDLDKLTQDDRVGIMRTLEGDLIFYINGESQGVAVEGLPPIVYAVVDLYGKCVQVTITNPTTAREHNNDDCLSGNSVLGIDNDILNATLAGDLSELSLSSSNSLDVRMDMNLSLSLPEEIPRPGKLRFHERCGALVKLSNGLRTAERRRPFDEFNHGVAVTHRPLRDSELFEIRIDRLVDKWSGSIEVGVTTHNPSTLDFPSTMTNLLSGTIMMSGCGILLNGKGTRREYGEFNLDELTEGDRVGMMRKPNGNLHYYINGLDQGVAARVAPTVWGVVDLYGMTTKVSIVERDEREVQNLITRRNTRDQQQIVPHSDLHSFHQSEPPRSPPDYYDRLTFHRNCGSHIEITNNGKTAQRSSAVEDFSNGVALTSRPLKPGEMFEVRLDKVISRWAGSIEIGVTTHSPSDLEFPSTMTNVRSGTWMMTGSGIMHNGTTVLKQYGVNLDRLHVSDRVGVVRKENGNLHFFVNGTDQGVAASNVAERVYGVLELVPDLYAQAVAATIVDHVDQSPDTINSSMSNTTIYSDLIRFHHVHGKNARIINNGLTAIRPRPLAEFNEGIVFSSRPLRDGELFEVTLENIVDRWSGSIELGVTAVRPDDIDLPSTATDLTRDTWMLSGSSIMENGATIKSGYSLDLDTLTAGVRVGVMRTSDKNLEFYKDGVARGVACTVSNPYIYAVVDLYGQCAQVSIPCASPVPQLSQSHPVRCREMMTESLQAPSGDAMLYDAETDLHRFMESHTKGLTLTDGGRVAIRARDAQHCVTYSATPLAQDEIFEVSIASLVCHVAGSISIGVTPTIPDPSVKNLPAECCYLTGNELHWKGKLIQLFAPNLNWLRIGDRIGFLLTHQRSLKAFINGEELALNFPQLPDTLYVAVELGGACSSVQVTSRKVPTSPLINAPLQDSLEIVLETDTFSDAPMASEEHTSLGNTSGSNTTSAASNVKYEFHDNHGRNIEITGDKTIARRVASYNQGLVIVQPALQLGQVVQVSVEQLESRWQSSLMCGVVCGPPERFNLPGTALAFKGCGCIIANDWVSTDGVKSRSNYGAKLNSLNVGSKVALMLTEKGVHLFVDGNCDEVLPWTWNNRQSCYFVLDLYGQCQQLKIINEIEDETSSVTATTQDCEKADLESCEKERSSVTSLSLQLPTTSYSAATNAITKMSPVSPSRSIPCAYQDTCEKFMKSLYLPDDFFTTDEPVCYCASCFKVKRQEADVYKEEGVQGWVKFPLRNFSNLQTDKWHTAYYGTKLSTIRCILDRGQPLTKNQMQYSNLVGQRADDVQVVFSPSLEHCSVEHFKLDNGRIVWAAFQLLVKPGAYSVSRDVPEWSTKETGALTLHALLLKMH